MSATPPITRFGSGKAVRRVEDEALLRGAGRFADDVNADGQVHVVMLRSPHPHAKLEAIDRSAAAALPGVVAIVTGADLAQAGLKPLPSSEGFKRADGGPSLAPPRHAIAQDVVRYVGEVVAVVVAATRQQARDAAEAIDVRYAPLPAVVDSKTAVGAAAPLVFGPATGNLCCEMRHGDAQATAAAFAKAAHVVRLDVTNQRVAPNAIEPRALLAVHDKVSGRTTLRSSSQTPTGVREALGGVFGVPPEQFRILVGDVGGGFGMKTGVHPEEAIIAYCARLTGRPVKWNADRLEEFLGATHGRDLESVAELALDADGKVLALRIDSLANLGAYATGAGVAIQLLIGPWVTTSIYDIRTIDVRIKGVLTHTAPTAAYRGAGRPEAIYTIERLFEAAARQMGMDAAELRRRNLIQPSQFPYVNAMQKTYDTGNFPLILARGVEHADWNGFETRYLDAKHRGKLRGRGMAAFLEWTGADVFDERVTVTVSADGYIEIFSATQAMGQGLATSYAQLAVDVFGVPIEQVRIVQGDTDRGRGFGSAGSRSLFVGGTAVHDAAERTVDKAKELAAEALEAAAGDVVYREGSFEVAGTDHKIGLYALAKRQPQGTIVLESYSKVDGETWPNGCHVCEVEIDPDTGFVEVMSYKSVNDVGRVVNPMIVAGQLDGGAVQGLGQALHERFVYDPASGQAITASFLDYTLPRADDVCSFDTTCDESTPCRNNPLGVKGVGELGTIGATPAVVNAVVDALARAGLGSRANALQMPLTSERVWQALQHAGR